MRRPKRKNLVSRRRGSRHQQFNMAWCSCRHTTTATSTLLLLLLLLLLELIVLLPIYLTPVAAAASDHATPGCRDKCGNVSIPFPFGMGDSCHIGGRGGGNKWFNVTCNESFNPPKPYLGFLEVLDISLEGQLTFSSPIARNCYNYNPSQGAREGYNYNGSIQLDEDAPFAVSNTRTVLTGIGCNTQASVTDTEYHTGGCVSICSTPLKNNSCSGIGCCQDAIPSGFKNFHFSVSFLPENHRGSSPCSYAFLIEKDRFNFTVSDLLNNNKGTYSGAEKKVVPAVLEWAIANQTCDYAQGDVETFACKSDNSFCRDWCDLGYRCSCDHGYRGNPYLTGEQGCQDINECEENPSICREQKCKNLEGHYICVPPHHFRFDGHVGLTILFGIGISLSFIFVCSWIYWGLKKRKLIKLREKFFQNNGGLLLQQQMDSYGVTVATKIFSAEELEKATNKYDETRIIGRGGYGTVYKGVLPDYGTVAIKKSKGVDESQKEQFINEVFILSQINHRNVVKLLGCCLETQVPLLVYEFISNGTLYKHIHDQAHPSSLSLEDRLRIASEIAGALAYMHFAASVPIFHRDVKSTNILLEKDLTAKVSDFGASRLIPFDQTQIATIVQGTLGYLDPEYLQTGLLTEKSDVYSFGVVLVELLTGDKPVSLMRSPEERNLSMYFLLSMKENCLFNVLERRVVDEGGVEQLLAVSQLAKRCLSLKREERPTMKEVAIELEELRRLTKHPRVEGKYDDAKSEVGESSETYRGKQDSLGSHIISPLDTGR